MNIVSFNIRGIDCGMKGYALNMFLEKVKLRVILLEETMINVKSFYEYFLRLKSSWKVLAWE